MSIASLRGAKQAPPPPEQADRWSGYGENTGIRDIWRDLPPETLRGFAVFAEFDDKFLADISADVTVAEWAPGSVLFEAGSYLDLAFWIGEGSVDLSLDTSGTAPAPIFSGSDLSATVVPRPTRVLGQPTGDTISFLATARVDLAPGQSTTLSEGEIFGEIGALNGWPQSVTAVTSSVCMLVQIRLAALRKIKRKSKALRANIDQAYRERTLHRHLRTTPLLTGCGPDVIDRLANRVELISLDPGEEVAKEGDAADAVYLVRSGFIKLSQRVESRDVVVSYASKGTTVGEVELLVQGLGAWQSTASSVGFSELVKISHSDFWQVLRKFPAVEQQLWESAVTGIKIAGYSRRHLHRSELTDFALSKGVVQGTSVLVIDLEVCTRCDDCVRGCASTHGGRPRFVREGEKHGGFLVARSCYHCEDPVCLVGCPTGAIARLNVGSVVAINDGLCIGCGNCASNCPYDAIIMHETGAVWSDQAQPARLRGEDRLVASKCDLCHDSKEGPACVSSCPHGCAYRVGDVEEFDALIQAKRVSALGQGAMGS